MALNWREIDRILGELNLEGCMIRQIHGPDARSIVLGLYKPGDGGRESPSLYISLSNPHCRLHRLTGRLRPPSRPYRFVAFLRSHIRGGRIRRAEQIEDQRIVRLEIGKGERLYELWIRLWAGAANIVLTDPQRQILDCFYRRPKRGEVTGKTFELPESRGRPRKEMSIREFGAEGGGAGATEGGAPHGSAAAGSGDERAAERGPYDYNRRVEDHFFALEERQEREALKRKLLKEVDSRESRILLKTERLRKREERSADADRLKELGDLITSSLHRIRPGDRWVETEDFYNQNRTVEIELNQELSPAQNAEQFYRKHRKLKRSQESEEEEMQSLTQALADLKDRRRRIRQTEDLEELRSMAEGPRSPATKTGMRIPGSVYETGPFRIIVGKTSRDNDRLLREFVTGNDYWFHARDFPGAYVFVRPVGGKRFSREGKTVPLETMLDAANLAIHHSKARNSGQGDVYYTQVKYLRRVKNGKRGLVIPTREKNLFVLLDPQRIERLKKSRSPE